MNVVKLTGRTPEARAALQRLGNPEHWLVIERRDLVGFSEAPGLWLRLQSSAPAADRMWVQANGGVYCVEVVR